MWMRLAGVILALAAPAQPQEVRIRWGNWSPPPADRIAVHANLVEVATVVRDARGNLAGGFHAADFEVLDNGKPQKITFFEELKHPREDRRAAETAGAAPPGVQRAPEARSIALWIDDVHVGPFGIAKARLAADDLVRTIAPGERIGIFTSSGLVTVELTSDTKELLAAVEKLRHSALPGPRELGVCPNFDAYRAFVIFHRIEEAVRQQAIRQAIECNCQGGDPACIAMQPGVVDTLAANVWTQLKGRSADAVESLKVPVQRLAAAAGSRILLMVSPGFVSGDLDGPLSAVTDAALRARIVVNALDPEGLSTAYEQRRRQQITSGMMADLSSATGGKLIQNSNDVSGGARVLTELPEVAYTLGFSPGGEPDNQLHALKVALKKGGGYRVEARKGYFSTEPPAVKETAQMRIDRAAMSDARLNEMAAIVRVSARDPKDGRYTLRVNTQLDAGALKFAGEEQRHLQQLTFLTVVYNAAGGFVAGKQAVMDVEAGPETFARLLGEGIRTEISFPVAPGSYRVRQVIREAVQNKITATDSPIQVR